MRQKANLALNILKSNFSRLPFPYKLTFAVTYLCNYRCKTCNIWQKPRGDEMTKEEFSQFFTRSNKFNWIDFTGGEVWMRSDFVDIVAVAIDKCRNLALLHFPTNGYMTDVIVSGVKEILKMKPPKFMISVSMDGDEEMNDDLRGKKGGWVRQIETYRRLHEMQGIDVVLGMTISSLNAGKYEEAFRAAKRECPWLKPKDFHINIAHTSRHFYQNDDSPDFCSNTENVIEEIVNYTDSRGFSITPTGFLEWCYLKNVEKYLDTNITPKECQALRASCFIDPEGNVYPCGMFDRKVAGVRDYDFDLKKIWDLPETGELQRRIQERKCPQCWTPCEAYQMILASLLRI